mmetsp:Transcript_54019/g.139533  ORF Transcript_54019/g.139533 Transcript_54019/m.139533 type:complete len:178 (-) Transcript_54019:474-1007(-)
MSRALMSSRAMRVISFLRSQHCPDRGDSSVMFASSNAPKPIPPVYASPMPPQLYVLPQPAHWPLCSPPPAAAVSVIAAPRATTAAVVATSTTELSAATMQEAPQIIVQSQWSELDEAIRSAMVNLAVENMGAVNVLLNAQGLARELTCPSIDIVAMYRARVRHHDEQPCTRARSHVI